MKKVVKILGLAIAVIMVITGGFLMYLIASDIPSYPIVKQDYTVRITPEAVERGQKLSMMLCAGCHLNRETGKLTGKRMMDAPAEFGVIYSQNITQDTEHGIGEYTDGELLFLLRTGIKRDGQYSPPWMAKLPNMADEDINAIIAFLRSDHHMVNADPTPDKACEPSVLSKFLCMVAFKPFDMPEGPISMPDTTNTVEWGKYLTSNLDCFSCHSADFKTNDFHTPELSPGYFAGGNKPLNEQGQVMLTPNLTPDMETGIGSWTKEQFIRAVKYGEKPGEKALQYPMMPYAQLTDAEVGAMFDYLQTIPAISNKVERSVYD